MYRPAAFAPADQSAAIQLMRAYPFATLITANVGRGLQQGAAPLVDHVPLLLESTGQGIKLVGHFSRANPHAAALEHAGRTVAIFHGPDAYVSPRWYKKYDVPTWNYAVVHAEGRVGLIKDPRALVTAIEKMVRHFEAPMGGPAGPLLPADLPTPERLFSAIVGFEIEIEMIDAKFKLSQNRSAEDRTRVESELGGSPDARAREVAEMMRALGDAAPRD